MSVLAPVVEGDGTTARSRARARWRRWAPWLGVLMIALATSAVLTARSIPEPGRHADLDPNGVGPGGSRALAQVLGRHGVAAHRVTNVSDATATDRPVVVMNVDRLGPATQRKLARSRADIVLVAPKHPGLLAPGVEPLSQSTDPGPVPARCTDPVARRAGTLSGTGMSYRATKPGAVSCFAGTFLRVRTGTHTVTVVGSADVFTNAHVLAAGNAAFALGVLGTERNLTWLMAGPFDSSNDTTDRPRSALDFLPRWFGLFFAMALFTTLTLMLWRGRRLGRLVTEPLPVVVPAAETVRGRATLYRGAPTHERVLAAHRAGALRAAANMLGLPARSDPRSIVDRWANAVGQPETQLADVLLGPVPAPDAAELLRRVDALDHALDELAAATGRQAPTRTPKGSA